MPQERGLPMTAGALLDGNEIYAHTSVRGDLAPELHPVVLRFFNALPAQERERFTGWCAEASLVSDQLYAAQAAGQQVTATTARAVLWGTKIRVTRVREAGDPAHGTSQPPCRSCAALLDWFGVEVLP